MKYKGRKKKKKEKRVDLTFTFMEYSATAHILPSPYINKEKFRSDW